MKRKKTRKVAEGSPTVPIRNTVAANPLLKKSGAHGKTRKAIRRGDKIAVSKMSFERIACSQAIGSNVIRSSIVHTNTAASA